ncbi:HAD family hydrolase [Anaerostipes sp.]|uniref:HAD family hydrolase n=1 Tax=Anaerostipes sp. TaxID=1872530 RepID=UPI0025B8F86E|nr:HAD family hydrolase [Anaerostipes sp.]MBS7007821.1 HAD family hydrolase [Anaerostipes sp.]
MDAILFDVDDTLYDQLAPFERAYKKLFGGTYGIDINRLFALSRKYSDEAFEQSQNGQMTMDEMYIYRIRKPLQEFHIPVSDELGLEFQRLYGAYQKQIAVSDVMKNILAFCRDRIRIGIITNGPSGHQWEKIKTLGLRQWFPEEAVFVSGDVGTAKPDRRIFVHACEAMELQKDSVWYVGDSFRNDVEGAKNAGLHSIWMNRRKHACPASEVRPDYCVGSDEELYRLLQKLL